VLPVAVIFSLAFQSLGVVYGDLGTSPLYVFGSTFPHSVMNRKDLIGALSLVIYTITLIPLVKYIFIVLRANDNGEDEKLSTFVVNHHHHRSYLQKKLEGSQLLQRLLLILVLFGTCIVIGDGILTPAISVLSGVSGIKRASSSLNDSKHFLSSLLFS